MRALLVAASAALAVLAGCATSSGDDGKPAETRAYVTGSNIARKVDQPTSSPTYGVSGDEMRKGRMPLPETPLSPECYRPDGGCGR